MIHVVTGGDHARLCSKDAVAGVAQTGKDVTLVVELSVDGGTVNGDFRMLAMDRLNAFRGRDKTDESHAGDARFFQE